MIRRNKYLNLLINNRDNGFPKVITGIRRCGKSYLLKEIYKAYLLESSVDENNILILELDDDRNILFRDPIALGEHVRKFCAGKEKCYVFSNGALNSGGGTPVSGMKAAFTRTINDQSK